MKILLFLGDSLIEWGDWQRRFPDCVVWNSGQAGETVQGLQGRLPELLRRPDRPDCVVLMTGTNNLAMDDFYFVPEYEAIVRAIASAFPEAEVEVNSLLPVHFPWQPVTLVPVLNGQIRQMCQRTAAHFVDLYSPFSAALDGGADLFEADGIHLADAGYFLWSKVLRETIPSLRR